MLTLLLATCETALDTFRTTDSPLDARFLGELERITEHVRRELNALQT